MLSIYIKRAEPLIPKVQLFLISPIITDLMLPLHTKYMKHVIFSITKTSFWILTTEFVDIQVIVLHSAKPVITF